MKICKNETEYIDAIAPAVQRACKRYGYLPSVLIAQSCLENGFGVPDFWDNPQIALLLQANNMVGLKKSLLNSPYGQEKASVSRLPKNTAAEWSRSRMTSESMTALSSLFATICCL